MKCLKWPLRSYCVVLFHRCEEDLEMTGLSGIEDIVGEMLDKGQIDPLSVGLTEQQAQNITNRTR